MFNSNPLERSVQGGFIGNAGAPDTTIAGTWARDPFRQGQQPEADKLFRRGMDNTPAGQRIKNLRDVMQSNPGSVLGPQAMGMSEMNIGNVGGMSTTLNPLAGPGNPFSRYIQGMENMQNINQQNNVEQQPEEREEDSFAGPGNPFSRYMQALTNMQQTKQAGFSARPELGQLAANQGPSSPVKYDESIKGFVPNQGATYPSNVRYKNFPGV